MSINSIFPINELSQTELDILVAIFSNDTVKKYLKQRATNDVNELLTLSAQEVHSEVIVRAHATVQGRLQVVSTLLSIGEVSSTPEVQSNQPN